MDEQSVRTSGQWCAACAMQGRRVRGSRFVDCQGMFLLAGFGGFCVNLAVFLVVQACSALTLKVLATLRNIGVVYISTLRYGEVLSSKEQIGYAISLAGFAAYQYAKAHPAAKAAVLPELQALVAGAASLDKLEAEITAQDKSVGDER